MKKLVALVLLFGGMISLHAQNVNAYKYVVVPETYDFTGEIDEYQLNSLTKFLLEQEGFETVMRKGQKPADLRDNPCKGLNVAVDNNSGIFSTKLTIRLEDCYGKTVFTSAEGKSREKDYKAAYHEALRDAFESVKELNYEYAEGEVAENDRRTRQFPKEKIEESDAVMAKKVEEVSEKEELEEVAETMQEPMEDPEDVAEAEMPEDVEEEEVAVIEEKLSEEPTAEPSEKSYSYNGQKYKISENEQGFGLYPAGGQEPIAMLIKSGNGSYIYNSLTNQGIAYFDNDGNLVVEFFNKAENKKVQAVYELQN